MQQERIGTRQVGNRESMRERNEERERGTMRNCLSVGGDWQHFSLYKFILI
jgi:hypothetical protein